MLYNDKTTNEVTNKKCYRLVNMVVYVEYVLIDNFIIDYFLLSGTFRITAVQTSRLKLCLCSLLGAVFALTYPLSANFKVLQTIIKIAFGLLLVLLSGKFATAKQYYASVLVFFCFTFLLGGAIFGLGYITGINFTSEVSVALIFIPAFAVCKGVGVVLKFIYKRKDVIKNTLQVALTVGNVTLKAFGFVDTGNLLYDGDNPVIVCSKGFAKQFFKSGNRLPKIKTLQVATVNGICQKPSIKIDRLVIFDEQKQNIFNNVTMCVTEVAMPYGEIILHPKFVEVNYDKQVV